MPSKREQLDELRRELLALGIPGLEKILLGLSDGTDLESLAFHHGPAGVVSGIDWERFERELEEEIAALLLASEERGVGLGLLHEPAAAAVDPAGLAASNAETATERAREQARGLSERTRLALFAVSTAFLADRSTRARELGLAPGLDARQVSALQRLHRGVLDEVPSRARAVAESYRARAIRDRARRIAETEITEGLVRGERLLIEEATLLGAIERKCKLWRIASTNPCPICIALASLSAVPASDPFVAQVRRAFGTELVAFLAPTAHPNCRCYLEYVSC